MTFDAIVDAVLAQGGFDVARPMAEGWVNERHREAVAEAQWLQQQIELGVTVADQADYALPENVVEVDGLYVTDDQAAPSDWRRVSTEEMWAMRAGRQQITGSGGVFAPKYGSAGERLVELFPTPEFAGRSITALASVVPLAMASGASPSIPEDMHGALVDGAIALGLERIDERADAAVSFEARFQRMVVRLRKRRKARLSSGPSRMRVFGHDFR